MKKILTAVLAITAIAFNSQAQGTWTQKANYGGGTTHGAIGFSIGSKGYIGSGYNGSYKNDFWEYDPSTDSWTQKANFGGVGRIGPASFVIGTKGYVGLGSDANYSFLKDFWEYNPASNAWTKKSDFGGVNRFCAAAFSIGNKGYIGTGNDYCCWGFREDFWEYNPATDTWTQKANFAGGFRANAVGFSIGDKGYIGTGNSPNGTFNDDFWEYDPVTDTWTQRAHFGGGAIRAALGFSVNNKGYIGIGLDENDNPENQFWEYDPITDTWTQKANFEGVPRSTPTGFSIGSKVYVGTGYSYDGSEHYYNDFWEYNACDSGATIYADADGDGYGDPADSIIADSCNLPAGYVLNNSDCNDANASIHPNQSDLPGDGIDNNCNGVIDENNALNFDGVNDYVSIPSNASLGLSDFTLEYWINNTGNDDFFDRITSTSNDIFETAKDGSMLKFYGMGSQWTDATTLPSNTWVHIAFVRSGSNFTIYKNAVIVINTTRNTTAIPSSWGIGQRVNGGGEFANMSLDEFRIWNIARTQEEIQADMHGASCGGQAGLVAYYNFNQGIASGNNSNETTLYDLTSNHNNGTLNNFALTGSTSNWTTGVPGLNDSAKFYQDADGDGYGNAHAGITALACSPPAGYVWDNTDCNDGNAAIHPGVVDVLNCIDDDCNGLVDEGIWNQKKDFGGAARFNAVGFSIAGKAYIGTGKTAGKIYENDLWVYDPSTGGWTQKANFGGTARFKAVGFSIGTKGYIGTGHDVNGSLLNDFWEYNAATNAWTKKANFAGNPRQNAAGFSIGDQGYIGTGSDFLTDYNDFWQYNPANDTWTKKADFAGSVRHAAAALSIDSNGYIGTGWNGITIFNDFWQYDPTTNTWTKKADFPGSPRHSASAFSIGSNGYIGMGGDDINLFDDLWQYDPATDTWTEKEDFTGTERTYAVGFAIGDTGYIGTGGDGNGNAYTDFYQYTAAPFINHRAYADQDGDGYGDASKSIPFTGCPMPAGYVADSTDCDDTNPNVHPYAKEICNGIDDNCDGLIDPTTTYYADADSDGYGSLTSSVQACSQPQGYVTDSTDCDDTNPNVHPGATEVCNDIDDNCNGKIDEGVKSTFYADADGDGYGNAESSKKACSQPDGYVTDSTDCDDTNPNVNPGAKEIPNNGIDDNCNGLVDEFGTGTNPISNSATALSVFPNPTNGNFIIELKLSNQITEKSTIEVIDVLGRIVLSQNAETIKGKLQQEIKLDNELSGIYSVKVIARNKVYTRQMSLQK